MVAGHGGRSEDDDGGKGTKRAGDGYGEADRLIKNTERRGHDCEHVGEQTNIVTLLDCIFTLVFFFFNYPKPFTQDVGVALSPYIPFISFFIHN
jgi:hypothetical protein